MLTQLGNYVSMGRFVVVQAIILELVVIYFFINEKMDILWFLYRKWQLAVFSNLNNTLFFIKLHKI